MITLAFGCTLRYIVIQLNYFIGLNILFSGAISKFSVTNQAYATLIPAFVEALMAPSLYPLPPNTTTYTGVYTAQWSDGKIAIANVHLLNNNLVLSGSAFSGIFLAYREPFRFQVRIIYKYSYNIRRYFVYILYKLNLKGLVFHATIFRLSFLIMSSLVYHLSCWPSGTHGSTLTGHSLTHPLNSLTVSQCLDSLPVSTSREFDLIFNVSNCYMTSKI